MTWAKGDLSNAKPVLWKNGGGTTRELACEPAGAGADDFVWRVSVADVTEDGPFSAFPGVQRVILGLSGGGFALQFGDGRRQEVSKPFVPFAFAGDADVSAHLLDGACRDFNLMVRAAHARGDVEVWRALGRHALRAPIAFAMVVKGKAWLTTSDRSEAFCAGEFVRRSNGVFDGKRDAGGNAAVANDPVGVPRDDAWVDLTSDAVVLVVKIWPMQVETSVKKH